MAASSLAPGHLRTYQALRWAFNSPDDPHPAGRASGGFVPAQDLHRRVVRVGRQPLGPQGQVGALVILGKKGPPPPVAVLRRVMGDAGQHETCDSGHAGRLSVRRLTVKKLAGCHWMPGVTDCRHGRHMLS